MDRLEILIDYKNTLRELGYTGNVFELWDVKRMTDQEIMSLTNTLSNETVAKQIKVMEIKLAKRKEYEKNRTLKTH